MNKPPLFFIHGMWSRPTVWDWLKARYERQGYKCFAPALPFHGEDARGRGDTADPLLATIGVQDYVDALTAAAREVGEPPVIVGHSMGGMLAQKLAETNGAAGLALLSPAPTAATGSIALAPLRTTFGITKDLRGKWWKAPTLIDEERARWGIFNNVPDDVVRQELDALVWDSGRVLYQISMPWADKTKGTTVDYDKLSMPAMVVVGELDRITPVATARATVRKLPGDTDYHEIQDAGHWLFHDPVRERLAEHMDAFLARL
ncbi:MAG: alpha/beta hydrolase [Pacificimonas sp.]